MGTGKSRENALRALISIDPDEIVKIKMKLKKKNSDWKSKEPDPFMTRKIQHKWWINKIFLYSSVTLLSASVFCVSLKVCIKFYAVLKLFVSLTTVP